MRTRPAVQFAFLSAISGAFAACSRAQAQATVGDALLAGNREENFDQAMAESWPTCKRLRP